jgi:hypothetical protein
MARKMLVASGEPGVKCQPTILRLRMSSMAESQGRISRP